MIVIVIMIVVVILTITVTISIEIDGNSRYSDDAATSNKGVETIIYVTVSEDTAVGAILTSY